MFQHRFRIVRARNPLVRVLVGLVGLVLAALLLTIGVFALAALVVGAGIFMLVRALRPGAVRSAPVSQPASPSPGVIEGEFTVVAEGTASPSPAQRSTSPAH
ncbi:MAG: hypothetical protein ABIR62_10770 [Dokdonella sp.]|uniref:hypothetical protein n=1 Tax=Dokdonella sp. TaxID=2291710 RepID=UPI0032634356